MTNETRRENSENDEIEGILESNVATLQSVISELEAAAEHIDNEADQPQERSQLEDSPRTHSSTVPTNFDLSEVLATSGQTRLVIADFDIALELLDSGRIDPQGELKLVITSQIAQQLSDRFPVNSYFQKLEERDGVKIRQSSSNSHLTGVVLLEDRSYYPISFGSVNTTLEITDSELHQRLRDEFDAVFGNADEINLKVPPWKELLTGLAEATSSETAREFETLVEAATPDDLDSLDEVTLALIAAARTGALQYNISKWGEEMNIGSKATFSRRKSTLKKDGIITTEPVQVEVGRPRDRLLLADKDSKSGPESDSSDSSRTEDTVDKDRSENDSRDPNRTNSSSQKLDDMLDEVLRDVLLDNDS